MATADLPATMVDLPVTMVDLPNSMVDLSNTMVDLPNTTLTHGCLKVHCRVVIVFAFLLILYSQGSIAWSLENV